MSWRLVVGCEKQGTHWFNSVLFCLNLVQHSPDTEVRQIMIIFLKLALTSEHEPVLAFVPVVIPLSTGGNFENES